MSDKKPNSTLSIILAMLLVVTILSGFNHYAKHSDLERPLELKPWLTP